MLPLPIPDTPRGSFYSYIRLKTRGKHNQSDLPKRRTVDLSRRIGNA
jgi:hypothetical protein